MLFYNTVEKSTLELLASLQSEPMFKQLRLDGGTSLSLQIGHRISVDLDLFGELNEDVIDINSALIKIGKLTQLKNSKNINIYLLNGIKIDLVNYNYPWLENVLVEGEYNLAQKKDIAAMKIAAITGRGSKKDFIDIYFLLKEMSLSEILNSYQKKYSDGSIFMALKSLIYFDDAEEDEMPKMLNRVTWEDVKERILHLYNEFVKN